MKGTHMRQRDVAKTLTRALELVEKGWGRNAPARDRYLQPVPVMDADAVIFSAQGACYRAAHELFPDSWGMMFAHAIGALCFQVEAMSLAAWQDVPERTLGEVREVFRRTIAESTPMRKREVA